jgi:ketosteroid isomerase-like protein
MSQENVELVRGAFVVLAAEGVEASLSFFAPECVWYTTDRWLDGSAYRGHDGIRELDAAFAENFDDWRFEVRDIRDAQDRVVALTQMVGRIRGSGSSVSQSVGFVISDFRGGTMGDIRAFATWADALDAAGLSE